MGVLVGQSGLAMAASDRPAMPTGRGTPSNSQPHTSGFQPVMLGASAGGGSGVLLLVNASSRTPSGRGALAASCQCAVGAPALHSTAVTATQ